MTDRTVTTMPTTYKIRSDGAVWIPAEVMALLRWQASQVGTKLVGTELSLTVDTERGTLTLSEVNKEATP